MFGQTLLCLSYSQVFSHIRIVTPPPPRLLWRPCKSRPRGCGAAATSSGDDGAYADAPALRPSEVQVCVNFGEKRMGKALSSTENIMGQPKKAGSTV